MPGPSGGGPGLGGLTGAPRPGGVTGRSGVTSGQKGASTGATPPGTIGPAGGRRTGGVTVVIKRPGADTPEKPSITFRNGKVVKVLVASGKNGPGGTMARREELRLDALEAAAAESRPVLLYVSAKDNRESERLEATAFRQKSIVEAASYFISVRMDLGSIPAPLRAAYGVTSAPAVVCLDPKGRVIGRVLGPMSSGKLEAVLQNAIVKALVSSRTAPGGRAR